jgi:nucleotide-binding universal stress UspA family protein
MISKILVPYDGSDHSQNALDYAVDMAHKTNAPLLVLHVHRPVPITLGEPNFQHVLEHMTDNSRQIMKAAEKKLEKESVEFTTRIIGGTPSKTIAEVAEVEKCDLIIMGSRGKSDLEGILLGSVTHQELQMVNCPVLVVR